MTEAIHIFRCRSRQLIGAIPLSGACPSARLGVLTMLRTAAPKPVSIEQMIEWLWGDDPGGGPIDPYGLIRVIVYQMRKRGVPIITCDRHMYALYGSTTESKVTP